MQTSKFTPLAAALLIGLSGLAGAQTTAEKPTAKEAATPSTVKQTQKPSSGMPDGSTAASPAMSGQMPATKPTAKEASTSTTVKQTVQAPGATDPTMPASGKAMKPKGTMKKDKKDAQANAAVGSGSAGTVEGRAAGSTNSNSKGEGAKM